MLDDQDEFGRTYNVIRAWGFRSRKEGEETIQRYMVEYGGVWVIEHEIAWFKGSKTWYHSWSVEKQEENNAHQAGHV